MAKINGIFGDNRNHTHNIMPLNILRISSAYP